MEERRAFFLAGVDESHYLFELNIVDLRPLLGLRIKWVAYLAGFSASHALFHELVVALGIDHNPGTGAAALSLVIEESKMRAFHGFVHICVGKDNVRALAAELEGDTLQVALGRGFHDQMADFG